MKILTAIGNPIFNEMLKNIKNITVIGKDIQYKEGIIEILEENQEIEILLLSDNLPGEIDFFKLINQIKRIQPKIDIHVLLERKNEDKENFLISKEIYKIYYKDTIDIDKFVKIFKENNSDVLKGINKEINELKKIILSENFIEDNYSYIEERIDKSFENEKQEEEKCQTIAISGCFSSGKSIISSMISKFISEQNKKTLLIDFDLENSSINTLFGTRKYKENQKYIEDFIFKINNKLDILCGIDKLICLKEDVDRIFVKEILNRLKEEYEFIIIDTSSRVDLKYVKIILTFCNKIIFLIEPNLLEISKSNKILEILLNDLKIDADKIKIVFNKSNRYKILESVLEEIFSELDIIGNIEYDEKYNQFINQDINIDFEKLKFKEIYENLIEKEKLYANSSVRN